MTAYYNEHDPKAAAWLRELIKAGLIAPGIVDQRSIVEVNPYELTQYTQHHFFAGIGGWSYALRLAGVPDSFRVATASLPCQPWSDSGDQHGEKDERHLWPVFRDFATFCGFPAIIGEQVASKIALRWVDGVFNDLEAQDYTCGAADLCAASVGSPQRRQRIFFMAHTAGNRRRQRTANQRGGIQGNGASQMRSRLADHCVDGLGRANSERFTRRKEPNIEPKRGIEASRRADAMRSSFWAEFSYIDCTDGKRRRFKPGAFPVAPRLSGRVGLLRGSGNAIVPEIAAEFIKAAIESITK